MPKFLLKAKRGFTLIELLVVIAIIGVLASIVLASLNTARQKSRDARRISDVKQLQLANELYFDANNSTYSPDLASLATGGFIPTIPTDPVGSAAYDYERCSNTRYHLGANLEDSSNPALGSDLNAAPTGCTGTWSVDTAGCGATPPASRYCYDVTN